MTSPYLKLTNTHVASKKEKNPHENLGSKSPFKYSFVDVTKNNFILHLIYILNMSFPFCAYYGMCAQHVIKYLSFIISLAWIVKYTKHTMLEHVKY
jgi:hypothetical protein